MYVFTVYVLYEFSEKLIGLVFFYCNLLKTTLNS